MVTASHVAKPAINGAGKGTPLHETLQVTWQQAVIYNPYAEAT